VNQNLVLNQKVRTFQKKFKKYVRQNVICVMYNVLHLFFLARMVWQGVSEYPSAPAFIINAIIRERKKEHLMSLLSLMAVSP